MKLQNFRFWFISIFFILIRICRWRSRGAPSLLNCHKMSGPHISKSTKHNSKYFVLFVTNSSWFSSCSFISPVWVSRSRLCGERVLKIKWNYRIVCEDVIVLRELAIFLDYVSICCILCSEFWGCWGHPITGDCP